ncbi:MAG: hypothetical protein ACI837_000693 [Crocinitomicaceae bacterium]|jgi:hypothetical protein
MDLLYDILEKLSMVSSLVPLLLFAFIGSWKTGTRNLLRLLFCMVILEVVTEYICGYLSLNYINNQIVIHLYTVIFTTLIFFLYRKLIKSRPILYVGLGLLIIFYITAGSEFIANYNGPNTYAYSTLSLISIFFSVALFFQMINDLNIDSFRSNGYFWINSAILFYFGTTFCLTLFESYVHLEHPDLLMQIWPIQLLSNIIFYFMLSRGIWLINRA